MNSAMTEPKARPILFSAPMIRAILDGRKTVTRRVAEPLNNPLPEDANRAFKLIGGNVHASITQEDRSVGDPNGLTTWGAPIVDGGWVEIRVGKGKNGEGNPYRCPYGKPGDLLWVRETHQRYDRRTESRMVLAGVQYRADDSWECSGKAADLPNDGRWRPSIHMFRWASRLTLRVESVGVERVQEISAEEAKAEGIERVSDEYNLWKHYQNPRFNDGNGCDPRTSFKSLWDSINAARGYGWESNPWVWRVGFKVEEARDDK